MITKPQNVYVMRDIMCSGYVAGGNTRWFGSRGKVTLEGPVTSQHVLADLNERLSFADDSSGEYCSMMAFLSSYESEVNSSRDQVISITDRLLPWEVSRNADPAKQYFPGGADGYNAYNRAWNLGQIHFGEDVRATENMAFMSQVCTPYAQFTPATHTHTQHLPSESLPRHCCRHVMAV